MWTVARYAPSSLFSLRPALSTASGAQSLLVPTPFAVKMALVDVAITLFGAGAGAEWWPAIRDLEIALDLPPLLVVNKTFIKIQRPTRVAKSKPEELAEALAAGLYPLGPTIAFREFVEFGGDLGLALRPRQSADGPPWARLLAQINYLGKRGGFFQLLAPPEQRGELAPRWVSLTAQQESFFQHGTLQMLDDCGAKLTWDHVNIYTPKSIKIGSEERVLRPVVLPYRVARSSYRYTLYERLAL
jgi:hypothetical protein